MKRCFIVFVAFLLWQTNVNASVSTLFDGEGSPLQKGWTLTSGAGHLGGTVTEQQQFALANNMFSASTTGMQYHLYSYYTGYESFIVNMRVKVDEGSHNTFDAGFMFAPMGGFLNPIQRINSVYIDPNEIGFMDESSTAQFNATDFHDYFINYNESDKTIKFYVDSSFDEIKHNNVNPFFSRTIDFGIYTPPQYIPGQISFGDVTNDPDVNSKYTLDYVKFEGIKERSIPTAPVPEPATLFLMGGGLVGAFWRRRKEFKS